jgi:2-polyprenyl-6-methoxyphenol hydroxylase-like FAD-dependent oxidoreductase
MTSIPNDRVIVVGAGPVGLTCAYSLAREDIPVMVLEREPDVPVDMRASTWHPPTLDFMDDLGVAAHLIAHGHIAPTWQQRIKETGERAVFDLGLLADETRHPYRLQCEQVHAVRYLADKLREIDPGALRFGATVESVSQDEDGVAVAVEKGGERETIRGRFLVGADGAHSIVRKTLGFGLEGKTYETLLLVATIADFPFEDHFEGLSAVNYVWTDEGSFSLLRVRGKWRSGIRPLPGQPPEEALTDAALQAHFKAIVPRDESYEIVARGMYRVHQRVTERFAQGRIALAGDAAHLNSPNGGMGMNCGIHDAVNLAGKLRDIWRGAPLALLDLYDRQRRPVAVRYVNEQADRNHRRMQVRDPEERRAILAEMQATAADPVRAKAFLMRTSMIAGVREAAQVA